MSAFRNLRLRLLGGGVVVGNIPSSNRTTFNVNSTPTQLDSTPTQPGIKTSSDPHNTISYPTNIQTPHNPRHITISIYTIYHNISKHNITPHKYITSHEYITFITIYQTIISISRHNITYHTNIPHQTQYLFTSIYIYHSNIRYHNSRPFIQNSHHPDTFHPQTYLIRPITQIPHPIRTLHPHLSLSYLSSDPIRRKKTKRSWAPTRTTKDGQRGDGYPGSYYY